MDPKGTLHKMSRSAGLFAIVALSFAGCASAPRWTGGVSPNAYYYQGVGQASTPEKASRSAIMGLVADINGIEVEEVAEDYRREHGPASETLLDEDFRLWIKTRSEGRVPPDTKVVDRWSGRGQEWAYAVVERPGAKKEIDRFFRDHMAGFVAHSFVPGWAQFQQRRNRAAWTYITGVGVGLVAGVTSGILSNDRVERRDRARRQEMRDYYDDQANQYYWLSVAGYTLSALSYGVNILDGQTIRVEPYQILTSKPGHGVRVSLAF